MPKIPNIDPISIYYIVGKIFFVNNLQKQNKKKKKTKKKKTEI